MTGHSLRSSCEARPSTCPPGAYQSVLACWLLTVLRASSALAGQLGLAGLLEGSMP
jgi:hypothetical protein